MKFLEYEAKQIFKDYNIPVPKSRLLCKGENILATDAAEIGSDVAVKAQVDVGGRGKAGGVLMADASTVSDTVDRMFKSEIKGLPVNHVLVEEKLCIEHEYYVSITIDRVSGQPVVLFAEAGGVDIEDTADSDSKAVRRETIHPLLSDIPDYSMRYLLGKAPKELAPVINALYHVFCGHDAMLAEINPLVTTPDGVYAADAKLIVDDNALYRQGIDVNRDLSELERQAEEFGFSFVELDGNIGIIGNGAGLTMATVDLINQSGGKPANFLDVGGGADRVRVSNAVKLIGGMKGVEVIVVNLLGGITRCDEVALGIIDAGVSQKVFVRLAGTNEAEGKKLLSEHGYEMLDTMEEVVTSSVGVHK